VAPAAGQIIAIGGFSSEPGVSPALYRYVLKHARRHSPAICLLATATGDSRLHVASFYDEMAKHDCRATHLPLFERTPDVRRTLLGQDVIFVGGGNTKSMLATWREWRIPAVLRQAWTGGALLAGVSAGAICWFEMGVTDSWAGALRSLSCLGFLRGTCCPHFDSEAERRPTLHQLVADEAAPKALALDDGVAAHFVGRRLLRIVSARPDAGAYAVRRRGSRAIETPLPVVRLDTA
jgi:dipeptidase E